MTAEPEWLPDERVTVVPELGMTVEPPEYDLTVPPGRAAEADPRETP